MIEVYIAPLSGMYPPTYVVMVDGKPYTTLVSRLGRLTLSEEYDIVKGFSEAFNYVSKSG